MRAADHGRKRGEQENAHVDAISVRQQGRGGHEQGGEAKAAQQLQRPGGVAEGAVQPVGMMDHILFDADIGQQFDAQANGGHHHHHAQYFGREQPGQDDVEAEFQPSRQQEGARRPDEFRVEAPARCTHGCGSDRSRQAIGWPGGRRRRNSPCRKPIAIMFHVASE